MSSWLRPSLAQAAAELPKERELKFGELLEKILDLRASNPAMVSHIVDLRKHLRMNQKETKNFLVEMDSIVDEVKDQQNEIITRQDLIVEMIRHQSLGIREIQEKLGCSNLVETPTTLVTPNSFQKLRTLNSMNSPSPQPPITTHHDQYSPEPPTSPVEEWSDTEMNAMVCQTRKAAALPNANVPECESPPGCVELKSAEHG